MKISVALCTYNGERFLKEQIDSILNQSVPVNEIIICDDCSSDSTVTILEEYNKKNSELFKIYNNESNLRSNKNFEKAINLTTGDYIFLSDQDDIWRNDKVEKIMEIFSKNPSAEGVFSNAHFIDENNNEINTSTDLWSTVNFFVSNISKEISLFDHLILNGNFVTGATLCIKKEVVGFVSPFLTNTNFLHDEWLTYYLSKRNTLFFCDENLINYRLHHDQQVGMGKMKNDKKALEKKKKYAQLILGKIEPSNYSESKKILKKTISQYQKYLTLQTTYKNNLFKSTIEELFIRYKQIEYLMKKQNRILFYFRKNKIK